MPSLSVSCLLVLAPTLVVLVCGISCIDAAYVNSTQQAYVACPGQPFRLQFRPFETTEEIGCVRPEVRDVMVIPSVPVYLLMCGPSYAVGLSSELGKPSSINNYGLTNVTDGTNMTFYRNKDSNIINITITSLCVHADVTTIPELYSWKVPSTSNEMAVDDGTKPCCIMKWTPPANYTGNLYWQTYDQGQKIGGPLVTAASLAASSSGGNSNSTSTPTSPSDSSSPTITPTPTTPTTLTPTAPGSSSLPGNDSSSNSGSSVKPVNSSTGSPSSSSSSSSSSSTGTSKSSTAPSGPNGASRLSISCQAGLLFSLIYMSTVAIAAAASLLI